MWHLPDEPTVPPFESANVYAYGTLTEAVCRSKRCGFKVQGDPETVEKEALEHLGECSRGGGHVAVTRLLSGPYRTNAGGA